MREIWSNEAVNFTPWLAEPENLQLLGETLGMVLDDARTEETVGSFSADILATDTTTNRRVLIENQLERTDHGHLGQILTYAAGLDALTVVWIAKQFTDEHRAALEWLNNHTSEEIGFFGLEIEVWKIGDSARAPKFNVVAKPNDWTKTQPAKTQRSSTQQAQLDFWTGFNGYAMDNATRIKPTAPRQQNWMAMGIGRAGFALYAIAVAWGWGSSEPEIRAELVMNGQDAKRQYEQLTKERTEIESSFSTAPTWSAEEGTKQRKIYVRKLIDWRDEAQRDECYRWLVDNLDRLHEVFQPRIQRLP